MKSYILSIDENLRVAGLAESLRLGELEPQIIQGVDGRNKSKRFFKKNRHNFLTWLHIGRKLSNEEIACALGHRLIYDVIRDEKSEWSLICEDDAMPQAGVSLTYISRIIDEVAANGDLIEVDSPKIIHLGPTLLDETDIQHDIPLQLTRKISNAPVGTYAYLINSKAIEKICSHRRSRKFISPADWPTQWRDQMDFFRSTECLFLTKIDSSYILESRLGTVNKRNLRGRIRYRIRKFFLSTSIPEHLLRLYDFIE